MSVIAKYVSYVSKEGLAGHGVILLNTVWWIFICTNNRCQYIEQKREKVRMKMLQRKMEFIV